MIDNAHQLRCDIHDFWKFALFPFIGDNFFIFVFVISSACRGRTCVPLNKLTTSPLVGIITSKNLKDAVVRTPHTSDSD
jgi:hypothetical protein